MTDQAQDDDNNDVPTESEEILMEKIAALSVGGKDGESTADAETIDEEAPPPVNPLANDDPEDAALMNKLRAEEAAAAASVTTTKLAATETTGSNSSNGTAHTDGTTITATVELSSHPSVGSRATKHSVLTTAVPVVDDAVVVVADVVDPEAQERERQQAQRRHKRRQTKVWVQVVVVGVVVVLGLILGVVFLTKNNNNSKNESVSEPAEEPLEDDSMAEDFAERQQAMLEILAPLYQEAEGGIDVFDAESRYASEDRIAALEWLVRDPISVANADTSDEYFDVDDDVNTTEALDDEALDEAAELIYRIRQRYVLAVLYFATQGDGWKDDFNFLTEYWECKWNLVFSQDPTPAPEHFKPPGYFNAKGVVCNDAGRVQKLTMYWNKMAGTIPHELSFFADDLTELQFGGGSIAGTIPSSLTKLTKIHTIGLHDHCLEGESPFRLSDFPDLGVYVISNNNFNLLPLGGSLADACPDDGRRIDTVVDCPIDEVNAYLADKNNTTPPWDCPCCLCNNPAEYSGVSLEWGGDPWTTFYVNELNEDGYPLGLAGECVTDQQVDWLAENCPCLNNTTPDPDLNPYMNVCTPDCDYEGAIPSYPFSSRR